MRFHAHSGQARVRLYGKVIYLGPWDSAEAKEKYHRLLVEWHGGQHPDPSPPPVASQPPALIEPDLPPPPAGLTLAELCLLWLAACEKKSVRTDGTTSSTVHECRTIIRAREPDGAMPACSLEARALIAVQQRLVRLRRRQRSRNPPAWKDRGTRRTSEALFGLV